MRCKQASDLSHDLLGIALGPLCKYVDGLATWAPPRLSDCKERATQVAEGGYDRILADIDAVVDEQAHSV